MENISQVQNQNKDKIQSSLISWYYMNRLGQWLPYPDNVQLCVEDCFLGFYNDSNQKYTVECTMENRNYVIDVKEKTQRNKKSGMTRKIMRIGDNDQIKNKGEQILVWQFLGDSGWRDYDVQSQKLLTNQYKKFKSESDKLNNSMVNLQILSSYYHINFQTMTQVNTKYKTMRKIRMNQVDQDYMLDN